MRSGSRKNEDKPPSKESELTAIIPPSPSGSRSKPDQGIAPVRPLAVRGKGNYIYLEDGREIFDACGGAAVACIGHGVQEVVDAMVEQSSQISYVPWGFFDNQSRQDLCNWFFETSNGHFAKAWITASGSEAMEGAMKLAAEYFVWTGEPRRVNYIAREESYHGITLGVLGLGGHLGRRAPFEPLLPPLTRIHRIPACNAYRQRRNGESDVEFVARKTAELEEAFQTLGPDTVAAVVAEPVVGAASGCTPSVPGYFEALRQICDRHGALLILDEVMCGMGRTGALHAWQHADMGGGVVRPDIQAVGKGLAGGYMPVSAILSGPRVTDVMRRTGAVFTHGHTYQDHPVACAAALRVQRIVQREGLLANVAVQGRHLETLLRRRLGAHRNVGDIRGRGLFWGIEFVRDRASKEPFDPRLLIAQRVHDAALREPFCLAVYYGQGCAGNRRGDHCMIMPAYNVTQEEVETIVAKLVRVVNQVFEELASQDSV
ncbi:aminotransferase, class III [Xylariomycetidae sp. FL0641]|nr:aminotransferase, class III [Xylariomycetidae sp. FL0641]